MYKHSDESLDDLVSIVTVTKLIFIVFQWLYGCSHMAVKPLQKLR
jgi:hypothetical protein